MRGRPFLPFSPLLFLPFSLSSPLSPPFRGNLKVFHQHDLKARDVTNRGGVRGASPPAFTLPPAPPKAERSSFHYYDDPLLRRLRRGRRR